MAGKAHLDGTSFKRKRCTYILLGTPTWMIQICDEILKQTGKHTIAEVWPKVSIFFHGAVRFDPYKKLLQEKIGKSIDYMNIYNASEGFFGFQYSKVSPDEFVLLTHYDVFMNLYLCRNFVLGHDTLSLCEIFLLVLNTLL
jgi:hypothetical protein